MTSIVWLKDAEFAFDSAQTTKKPVLLDFHNPQCIGCQQMDAVTYQTPEVISFIDQHLTQLRVNVQDGSMPASFRYTWTPSLAILTPTGHEVQRTIGFLGPEEFIVRMHLGIAKVRLETKEYDTALIPLKSLMETFPENNCVPEAIYISGVAAYKKSNDPHKLKEAYEKLLREYPDSIWTEKASPYRLIQ